MMNTGKPALSFPSMHRLLSIVMVLLLVLRGLLGDAMAMGAAPAPAMPVPEAHHHAPAQATQAIRDSAGTDHAMHHGHGSDQAQQATACAQDGTSACGSHEHGSNCTLCGICHSAMYTPCLVHASPALAGAGLRPQGHARFASAARLPAIKPPIS